MKKAWVWYNMYEVYVTLPNVEHAKTLAVVEVRAP